jgi:hypothetical protein
MFSTICYDLARSLGRHLFKFEHFVAKEDLFSTLRINHYIRNYFLENPIVTISEISASLNKRNEMGLFF